MTMTTATPGTTPVDLHTILVWTHEQTARMLGISKKTLQDWRQTGVMPACCWWKPPGRQMTRYRRAQVVAWVNGELPDVPPPVKGHARRRG